MDDMLTPLGIVLAFLLDLLVGDPDWSFHPIRIIGRFIRVTERCLTGLSRKKIDERLTGCALCLFVISSVYLISLFLLWGAYRMNGSMGLLLSAVIIFFSISLRALAQAALLVRRCLKGGDEGAARRNLSLIVGRDTGGLDREEIIKATIETVAENTSDGIIAPLFYLLLGGPPLGMAYKALNTLDSMVGYKNPRYRNLGWASARCDDIANYIPARITGFLLVASAVILRKDWKNALSTMLRDGRKHISPNSGYPESAVAGALNLSLGGTSYYDGRPRTVPSLGHQRSPCNEACIVDVVRMMYCASLIVLVLLLLVEVS